MLNLLVLTFYFSYSFAVPTDGKLKFTITEWIYNNDTKFPPMMFKFKDDSVMISCETNDLDAIVSLLRRKSASTPYTSAQEFFKQRVTVVGQTFHISSLSVADGGFYTCNASNSQTNIMLPLGQLIISPSSPDRIPEIFPQTDNNTISIESNGSKNITCKTFGAAGLEESYLNWYKEVDSTLVPVEKSKLSRQQDIYQSQHIDIEILMFKNYKVTDGGKYVCQRKVLDKKPTSAFINIVLEPDRAPTVQLPNLISTFIELKNGQKSFQITCEVSGSPKPIRQWVKDGQVVQNCLDDSNFCHLYLSEISYPANDGIYSCVGTNAVGKANQSVTIQVNVPVILKKLPSTIAASVNDVKLLNCEIQQGNPLPVFQWQVQPNTYDVSKGTYDTAEWTSVSEQYPDGNIPSTFSYIFSENSQASYRCLAKNSFSTDEFTVSVVRTASESPEFTFSPVTEQILINEQDKLYLKCETSLSLYESCTLKKDEQVLEAKKTSGTKLRLLEYEISSVIMSDAGSYECIGTLKKGGAKKLVRSIIVQKLIKPSINNFNDVTILQDEVANTKLTCNSSGNPPPLVTWKHNGVLLSSIPSLQSIEVCKHSTAGIYQSSEMKNELILCQLDYQQHQGSFECTASNKIDSASKTMNLTIKVKPRAVEWKSEVVFGAGSSSELNCVSYANPPANVTWFRVNNKNQSAYLISRMGASQYIVGNAIVEDSGLYMCTAENELGKFEKMVRVIVKGSSGAYIGSMKKETLIAVLVPAIIILLVALTAILFYRRYLKHKYALYLAPDKDFIIDPDRTLFEQSGELPYDMSWEFPRDRLKFIKTLGSGAFGEVWLAEAEGIHDFRPRDLSTAAVKQRKLLRKQTRRYTNFTIRYKKNLNTSKIELEKTMVAVKTLKDDASEAEYKDLATELKILIHLGEHKNIVNLLGACTTKGEKLQVILECCPGGNLLNFLRSKRDIFKNVWFKKEADMENEFTLIDLVLIVYQISKGMDFLQSKKCVHRDLAARNVLVGPDFVMKVADFGLARDIYKNEFYLKETTGLLPVKWMAPESLFDKIYTSSSDVWSYGILLWEVYTLGGSPYPGLPTEELFNFLEEGRRMDCPEICPKSIYEIMLDCWKKSPYDRPLFVQITERLSNILRQNVTSGCEYLVENDLPNGNNYLLPTNVQMKKSSSDYLVADKTSPKKRTYVPEPNQRLLADEEDMSDSALPPVPFSIGDGYVPMNYISPRNFHYAKEARV